MDLHTILVLAFCAAVYAAIAFMLGMGVINWRRAKGTDEPHRD